MFRTGDRVADVFDEDYRGTVVRVVPDSVDDDGCCFTAYWVEWDDPEYADTPEDGSLIESVQGD